MPTPQELIDAYLAGRATLRRATAGMTPDQLRARPVPGKWSTLEVVCHLADFDAILADRMKRIIALDRPALLAADENHFAATLACHDRDLDEELLLIDVTRAQMARILRALPPATFAREGIHSEKGPRTLLDILTAAANHIPHHVAFIDAKRRALGLPA